MELSKTILDNVSYTVGNDSVITDSQYLCILKEIFSSASGKAISKGVKSFFLLFLICYDQRF